MWKNIAERGRSQMTVWRMRTVCWTTKATYIHSEYVTLNAFHGKNGYAKALPCYVIRALPVFPNAPTEPLCLPLRPRNGTLCISLGSAVDQYPLYGIFTLPFM
jgi:hypothetical protein